MIEIIVIPMIFVIVMLMFVVVFLMLMIENVVGSVLSLTSV
jgi:hypothetical protein